MPEAQSNRVTVLRTFMACEVPADLQASIQTAVKPLRRSLGSDLVRWVPAQNVHLTLKFLGDVALPSVEMIQRAMATEAARCEAFEGSIEGLGAFPNLRHPSVLWIGLSAPPALGALQRQLDVATERLGYKGEAREFAPHLTLGRVRNTARAADLQKVAQEIERLRVGKLGRFQIGAVHLFKSDLRSTGPIYTKLYSIPLGIGQ